jgi:hypothetical protein
MYRFDEAILFSPVLRAYLANIAAGDGGTGEWWGLACLENFEIVKLKSSPHSTAPYEGKRVFAEDICRALNREIDQGGSWLFQWTHPNPDKLLVISLADTDFERFHMIWLDRDGDPQFFITNDDPFLTVVREPASKWLADAVEAWMRAREMIDGWLDPSPAQQFKAVQGERKPAR